MTAESRAGSLPRVSLAPRLDPGNRPTFYRSPAACRFEKLENFRLFAATERRKTTKQLQSLFLLEEIKKLDKARTFRGENLSSNGLREGLFRIAHLAALKTRRPAKSLANYNFNLGRKLDGWKVRDFVLFCDMLLHKKQA